MGKWNGMRVRLRTLVMTAGLAAAAALWAAGCSTAASGVEPAAAGAEAAARGGTFQRTIRMEAGQAFEAGMECADVQHNPLGEGVALYDATLVEDDSPGSGSETKFLAEEDRSPVAVVNAATQLKKVLVVEKPEALEAMLYVRAGKARISVNGTPVPRGGSDKYVPVPVSLIRKGENEVVLSAEGNVEADIKVAARRHILQNAPELKDRPPRSFTSADGGKTWQPIDGELTVRLNLVQFAEEGGLTSPVIDLASGGEDPLGLRAGPVRLHSVTLKCEADTPRATSVELAVRTGSTPLYEAKDWTGWQKPSAVTERTHRYLQWRATLRTDDPRQTPVLKSVTAEAKVSLNLPAWAEHMALRDSHNEEVRYTSMPFEYEDPSHPRMVALREKYKLDDVVAPGKTELEKLVLLRDWVGRQWRFKSPSPNYPAWDADEIMTAKIGFCVQFAITYIQCCNALGYPARFVCGYHPGTMGTAHEVSEVWSNEHAKWVFMDPTPSRNQFCADPKTGEPLSMLEVHERMVRTYYGDKPPLYENRPKAAQWSNEIALCNGKSIVPTDVHTSSDPPPSTWPSWTKWLLLCYAPRNNFSARPRPLPRMQGWNNWDWAEFRRWVDPGTPKDWRYRYFTSRRSDLLWTLNQVRFGAACGNRPGTLEVRMATVTPNFKSFLVRLDGGQWRASGRTLDWPLHQGRNRLEMRVRNTSDVVGPVSFIELDYQDIAP